MTDYPKGTFKYIDKDKILPALRTKMKRFVDMALKHPNPYSREQLLGIAEEIGSIIDDIELGMYDFQMGSE